MRRPRYSPVVGKSLGACIAAIEIYNKPDFRYREEAFAILMLNAWELLLKARILKANKNKLQSVEIWEPRKNKDGKPGKRKIPKRGRSGNKLTIDVSRAAGVVRQYANDGIDDRCLENLQLLVEIRDSAVHLVNVTPGLGRRIQEVGTASLKNYATAAERWFSVDLSRYNFFLMPISFHTTSAVLESLTSKRQPAAAEKLLNYIADRKSQLSGSEPSDFNVTLRVELQFAKANSAEAIPVRVSKDPKAIHIQLTEESFRRSHPWTYDELRKRLRKRYSDFSENKKFHDLRKPLEKDARYCHERHLDPDNAMSGTKKFYNPNIQAEFDLHYTRRSS